MPIFLLCLALVVFAPIHATAQNASPTEVRVYAIGGFLGQLDGFCEQPGGTYQMKFIDETGVQSCAKRDGSQPEKMAWPVAFGGMLGAQTRVADALAKDAAAAKTGNATVLPLVVVPGNNQVANFAFLEDAAVDPNSDYRLDYRVVAPQAVTPSDDRLTQTRTRLRRFWQEMSKLRPQAIGLGAEDFIRSLRDPRDSAIPKKPNDLNTKVRNRGSILHRFLRQVTDQGRSTRIPIIGSNVVIKTRREVNNVATPGLNAAGTLSGNDVKQGDFSLVGLVKQESIGWMTEITVAHPAAPEIILALWEIGPVGLDDAEQHIVTKTTDGKSGSTKFESKDGTLKPGYRYEVRVRQGKVPFTLKFQTHLALTPRSNSQEPEKQGGERRGFPLLDGFPVIAQPLADGSPLMILSLVDPSVKKLLGEDAWKWEQARCQVDADLCDWKGLTCPAKECEIDFMSPEDAITAAIVRSDPKGSKKPFILLLSALTDAQNQELLEQFPEIRILILAPDSHMIGRASRVFSKKTEDLEKRLAARKPEDQAYSGDLGFSAVLNAAHPQGTTLVARPEWVGETLAQISASVTYTKEAEWQIQNGAIDVHPVPGAALGWRTPKNCPNGAPECPGLTEFFVRWPSKDSNPSSYGSFPSYLVCEPKGLKPRLEVPEKDREAVLEEDRVVALEADPAVADQCTMFAKLWTQEFSTFAGHSLRQATGSELSVVPGLLLDQDAQAWLEPLIDKTRTRMLTRFILERSVLRSFRIVRAEVAGDALLKTLASALKSETYVDSCVVGLSSGCDAKVDPEAADTVRVNGRAIDSRSFYTVALPEGLAEELKLPYSKNNRHTTDAVSALNERLARPEGWYLTGRTEDRLGQRIEKRAKKKYQFDFLTSALELGYTRLNPDDALNDGNTLGALDVDFRGATKARTLTSKLDVDIALLDFSWVALRGIGKMDFNRRTDINDETGNQISYPDNNLTFGGRLDWKQSLLDREMRIYGGYFVERDLEGPREYFQAQIPETVTTTFTTVRREKTPTLYQRKPLEFDYYAGGVDYLNVKKLGPSKLWVELSRASIQYGHGRLYNVPIGASINGFEQLFGDGGAKGVLNAYYASSPSSFNPKWELVAKSDEPRKQHRLQTEFNFKRDFTFWKRTFKFDAESRWRFFPETADTEDDSLRRYLRLKINLSLPVLPRVELVPSFEYHRAKIKHAADGKVTFTYSKIEANLKIPFVIRRAGWGWLAR